MLLRDGKTVCTVLGVRYLGGSRQLTLERVSATITYVAVKHILFISTAITCGAICYERYRLWLETKNDGFLLARRAIAINRHVRRA